MPFRSRVLLPVAAAAVLLAAGPAALAKTVPLTGNFSAENGTKTMPIGMVKGTLNTVTDMLSYTVTYSRLSGPVRAAHFHGPAAPGVEAGVLVPIPGPYHSGMTRKTKVTAAEAKDILAGKTYINLHTAAEPNGEARAQVNPE